MKKPGMKPGEREQAQVFEILKEGWKQVSGLDVLSESAEAELRNLSKQIVESAREGGEVQTGSWEDWKEWISRFQNSLLWFDLDDYVRVMIRALLVNPEMTSEMTRADFGTSRQRDAAQSLTDTMRGYLGELAVARFLKNKFNVEVELPTRRGSAKEFISSDIERIKMPGEDWRPPELSMSIKTTKFQGVWLEMPESQFKKSDVFVMVRLGISRMHLIAFFKTISLIKGKIIPKGIEINELDQETADVLWKELPDFQPIPAYIVGFVERGHFREFLDPSISKKKQSNQISITIKHALGVFDRSRVIALVRRKYSRQLKLARAKDSDFEVKIHRLNVPLRGRRFLASSGKLRFREEEWRDLVSRL
mgnify:CR=1 FL=1|jgi:hypothetical protein